MRLGTPGFNGSRLREAREARGLTATSLAELLGLSRQAVSQYERGETSPSPDILYRLATMLNMPVGFFALPPREGKEPTVFYRSMASATKGERTKSERRFVWLEDIVQYLSTLVELPSVQIPPSSEAHDVRAVSSAQIEEAAAGARQHWKLSEGPISNVAWLLEHHGVIITRGLLETDSMDAFSAWMNTGARPFVFLNADKQSAARSRYDLAHELGHLVLHRHRDKKNITNPTEFKLMEAQANSFASAFLLPSVSFAQDLFAPTLEAMHALKEKWGISIGAMIMRARDLGMITPEHAERLLISRARRGWVRREPLDDTLPIEEPVILRSSFELIIANDPTIRRHVVDTLYLSPRDIEQLASLPPGLLDEGPPTIRILERSHRQQTLHKHDNQQGLILEFPDTAG